MTTEKVKLYNVEDQLIDIIEIPKRLPDQGQRRIIHGGLLFVEGGGPESFYCFGEFAEVRKDA